MCETCDLEARHPSGDAVNICASYGYFKYEHVSHWKSTALYYSLAVSKTLSTISLSIFLLQRIHGDSSTRPSAEVKPSEATYPYSYDQLGPEFDQYGRGIFFLPASASGNNIKNAALRRIFDASQPPSVKLAVATLILSFIEVLFLDYVAITSYGASPLYTGEWSQSRDKSHSLQRKVWSAIELLYLTFPTVAHLGACVALVATECMLANTIRADPTITAYLNEIQIEYPGITNTMIEDSIRYPLYCVSANLYVTSLAATTIIVAVVCMRLGFPRHRRRAFPSNGISKVDEQISLEKRQVARDRGDRWDDAGPLAQAYKIQLDNRGLSLSNSGERPMVGSENEVAPEQ